MLRVLWKCSGCFCRCLGNALVAPDFPHVCPGNRDAYRRWSAEVHVARAQGDLELVKSPEKLWDFQVHGETIPYVRELTNEVRARRCCVLCIPLFVVVFLFVFAVLVLRVSPAFTSPGRADFPKIR